MGLFSELRRRNVFRMAVLYVVAAWLIMQVTEVLITLVGLPLWVGQAVLAVLAVGLPIALAISWFYELTPEGLKPDKDVAATESVTHITGRHLDSIVIALLVAAVLVLAFDKWWLSDDVVLPAPSSVAVLPFVNTSSDPEMEYFSDGLTEALLNTLARSTNLTVSARTSVFHFKGKDIDVREVATALGVENILEGSVQRDGDTVRIMSQLIDAENGFELWSSTYDRALSDIFAVQDDIANNVAAALNATLDDDTVLAGGEIITVSTHSVAAYDKYLLGLRNDRLGEPPVADQFKEALALDPGFYEARLQLGYTYLRQLSWGAITNAEASELIQPVANRLIEERPGDVRGTALRSALAAARFDNDSCALAFGFSAAEEHAANLAAAIEESPTEIRIYSVLAQVLINVQKLEEALGWVNRGIALDPFSGVLHFYRSFIFFESGDLDGAEAAIAEAKQFNPDFDLAFIRNLIAWERGQYTEWFAMWKEAVNEDPLDHEGWALVAINLYSLGLMDEGDKYLQRAVTIASDKAFVRATELQRLMLSRDYARARGLSEAMLRDDVDNRRGSHWFATIAFMSTMSEFGKFEEALTVLEELRPGVLGPDFRPNDIKDMALQYHAVLLRAQIQSQEESLKMLDAVERIWDESLPEWRSYPGITAQIAMVRGQKQMAIDLTLEDLEVEFAHHHCLGRQPRFQPSFLYKELAMEPAIAERLNEIAAEARRGGEEVRAYILERHFQL